MEQAQMPDTYDYRQYDRVWQRVSPSLDPYPGMRTVSAMASPPAVGPAPIFPTPSLPGGCGCNPPPAIGPAPIFPTPSLPGGARYLPALPGGMLPMPSLPGAQADPCCMGSAAQTMILVLRGFIEEELAGQRYYLTFSRQAPQWARQTLRDIADAEGAHAKRLMAVHYLITGMYYRPVPNYESVFIEAFCPALRGRYHAEACDGLNYARAADGTTDPCLSQLLNELSQDEYRHAERMLTMLERGMR